VLATFGATARNTTDLAQLNAELAHVMGTTMQPKFIGLWLRESETVSALESSQSDSEHRRNSDRQQLPRLTHSAIRCTIGGVFVTSARFCSRGA